MTEAVVHRLEVIEIQEEHGQAAPVPIAREQRLVRPGP